jgi:hypothetical protein
MDINVVLMVSVQHTFRHTHTHTPRVGADLQESEKKTCRETTAELFIYYHTYMHIIYTYTYYIIILYIYMYIYTDNVPIYPEWCNIIIINTMMIIII